MAFRSVRQTCLSRVFFADTRETLSHARTVLEVGQDRSCRRWTFLQILKLNRRLPLLEFGSFTELEIPLLT